MALEKWHDHGEETSNGSSIADLVSMLKERDARIAELTKKLDAKTAELKVVWFFWGLCTLGFMLVQFGKKWGIWN